MKLKTCLDSKKKDEEAFEEVVDEVDQVDEVEEMNEVEKV